MLGLQRGIVQVVPYTAVWATLFQEERARLRHTLGAHAQDIQHVGSTAVPGLAAKPILDLAIAVAGESDIFASVPLLATLGYTYRGDRGPHEGHFFDRGPEPQLTHYLHMLSVHSLGWRNYLRFRNYLLAHPEARDAYQRLK